MSVQDYEEGDVYRPVRWREYLAAHWAEWMPWVVAGTALAILGLIVTTVIILLLWVWPTTAHAALTDPEAAQIRTLGQALVTLHDGQRQVAHALRTETTTEKARDDFWHTLYSSNHAHWFLFDGLVLLLDIPTGSATARAETLAEAWQRVNIARIWVKSIVDHLPRRFPHLTDAQARYRTVLDTLTNLDRSPGYAEPKPPHYPKVIGPHGRYDQVQWWLWMAMNRLFYSEYAMMRAYRGYREYGQSTDDPLLADYGALSDDFMVSAGAMDVLANAVIRLAQADMTPENDPFFSTIHALNTLTEPRLPHAPVYYKLGHGWKALLLSQHDGSRPVLVRNVQNSVGLLAESERSMLAAIWELMVFPDCTNPGGCGGR